MPLIKKLLVLILCLHNFELNSYIEYIDCMFVLGLTVFVDKRITLGAFKLKLEPYDKSILYVVCLF